MKKLTFAAIFSDDMVIQRDMPVSVWGSAAAGETVEVLLDNIHVQTTTAEDGQWQAVLPAGPAGGPWTLTARCGSEEITLRRIYRGEVFLAGGQSNMEFALKDSQDGAEAVENSTLPRLHFYMTPKAVTVEEAEILEQDNCWKISGPETVGAFSAVAYYAGRTLAEHLPDIHIGVIACCWGGTFAHCWIPEEDLLTFPEGRWRVEEYNARIGEKSDEEFARELLDYQADVDIWNARIAICREKDPAVTWVTLNKECGLYPWPPPAGRTGFQRPGLLYKTMLCRLKPFSLRGFWYYQGEQDEDYPEAYAVMLNALIRRWRLDWENSEMPFLLVQLPMYISNADSQTGDPMCWPVLRKAQASLARTLPNVGLTVLADCGEFDNVHPTDKRTPGERLGLLTLETIYKLPVTGVSPVCVDAQKENSGVTLRFDHTGGGLQLTGGGFQLVDTDGVVHEASAQVLGPDMVQVTGVPEPVEVRYAWYSYGPAGLHGGTGLAAEPFALKI